MRIAVIGGIGVALFAVLFFRLWSLQIVTGDKYLAEANQNRTREIRVLAPRGRITDRDGNVLVDNRTSMALQVDPTKIPYYPKKRAELFTSIGDVLGKTREQIHKRYRDEIKTNPPGSPITLADDVSDDVAFYIQEHQFDFPEVDINRVFVRRYPQGTEAAHLLGSVGEVTADDLKQHPDEGLEPGDTIGKGGLEQQYDSVLRGQPGETRIQVDSTGQIKGQLKSSVPEPGKTLRLTIDPKVQQAGEAGLASIGLPGGFVAMNVNSGEVLGIGSAPTFDPTIFTHPITQSQADALFSEEQGAPMFNRAISGNYPTGSIYKPITALAALSDGTITPSTVVNDTGSVTIADQRFQNAGNEANGPVSMQSALTVSSDVYFYELGAKLNRNNQLQKWSKLFGIGIPTGIDLPGESAGFLPTKAAVNKINKDNPKDPYAAPWVIGDNIQLAIGQGSLQTNPLQMATAYAALGNGGKILKPRLNLEEEDSAGRVLKESSPEVVRRFKINPAYRDVIMSGLHDAAQTPSGTSYKVFGGFPVPVAGKTGTAQRPPNGDQAWYAVLAPYPNPKIVVVTTIEQGGFGADTAAPVAEQILSAYFNKTAKAVSGGGNVE